MIHREDTTTREDTTPVAYKSLHLHEYDTGDRIRPATAEESAASIDAARHDGGAGVITVVIDGTATRCYCQ